MVSTIADGIMMETMEKDDVNALQAAGSWVLDHWSTFTETVYEESRPLSEVESFDDFYAKTEPRKRELEAAVAKLEGIQAAGRRNALEGFLNDLLDGIADQLADQVDEGNPFRRGSSKGVKKARKGDKGTCAPVAFRHKESGTPFSTSIRSLRDRMDADSAWERVE
jgi:hypothetical protein